MFLEVLIIFSLSILFRFIFVISESSDDDVHIWNISQRKLLSSLFSQNVTNSVIEGKRGYPILHHYIISLFPKKDWYLVGKVLSITYDLIVIISFYYIINLYFKYETIEYFTFGFWAGLLLSTSPILFPLSARIKAIGGRTIGFLFFSSYSLILYNLMNSEFNIYLFGLAIFIGVLLLLSSQFATQFYIFYNIIISIILLNYIPILILLFFIFVSLSFKPLREIINFKIAHIKWFLKYQKGTTVEYRNKFKELISLPYYLFKKPGLFIKRFFYENSYIAVVINVPLSIFLSYICFTFPTIEGFLYEYLVGSILATFILFLITSHKPLIIFGEAERYFEFISIHLVFLLMICISNNIVSIKVLVIFLLVNIITILFNYLLTNRSFLLSKLKNNKNSYYLEIIDFLDKFEEISILTIPIKDSFKLGSELPNHKFYYRHINKYKSGFTYFGEETLNLSIPKQDWSYFKKEYMINIIVIDKDYKNVVDVDSLVKLFENKKYLVYKIS